MSQLRIQISPGVPSSTSLVYSNDRANSPIDHVDRRPGSRFLLQRNNTTCPSVSQHVDHSVQGALDYIHNNPSLLISLLLQINIAEEELDLLRRKLELVRLDARLENEEWGEPNGVTYQFMKQTLEFWRTEYDWRQEESLLNQLPQFKTAIDVDGFGTLDAHFVHAKSTSSSAIPLLFVHGWPGSFKEVEKILPSLNEAGFDVVAPSLPGYGFSSFTHKAGFDHKKHAEFMYKIMIRLGYEKFVVQGGDWGSFIVRTLAILYPNNVRAMHVNMVCLSPNTPRVLLTSCQLPMFKPSAIPDDQKYTELEQQRLGRLDWFVNTNSDYSRIQGSKPRTLGFGLHDSPVAMLAWMADKLVLWSDEYPWTPTEIVTWTILHYLNGPTSALHTYREIPPKVELDHFAEQYVDVPSGASAFPQELMMVPRSWAEKTMNVQFWAEHKKGGHFAAYEKPQDLAGDMIQFYKTVWRS